MGGKTLVLGITSYDSREKKDGAQGEGGDCQRLAMLSLGRRTTSDAAARILGKG